jgi:formylmethanofuran dehydrogenase subunit D
MITSVLPREHTVYKIWNEYDIPKTGAILPPDRRAMAPIEVTVISGRSLSQARSRELGKFSDEYSRSVAICELDPEDMSELGILEGESVRVKTKFGEVILRATASKQAPHKRIVFIPYGAWASMLFGTSTHASGMPTLKGVKATLERTPREKVATLEEITRMKAE